MMTFRVHEYLLKSCVSSLAATYPPQIRYASSQADIGDHTRIAL